MWAASEQFRIPVLCHTGQGQAFSEPDQFHEIAPRYPDGAFIIGHTGETFAGMEVDTTEENIQARCRGIILMAISNKKRKIEETADS